MKTCFVESINVKTGAVWKSTLKLLGNSMLNNPTIIKHQCPIISNSHVCIQDKWHPWRMNRSTSGLQAQVVKKLLMPKKKKLLSCPCLQSGILRQIYMKARENFLAPNAPSHQT